MRGNIYNRIVGKACVCQMVGRDIQVKFEGLTSVEFLGALWCRVCQDISCKWKDKLLYLALPTTKKTAQHSCTCLDSEEAHSALGCVIQHPR